MGFKLTTLVVIGTDCIGKYKSNYHTIMTTTAPYIKLKSEVCLLAVNYHLYMGFSGFRGEDLNVKVYDIRRTTDAK
jgi:hypothetical protein